MQAVIAGGGAAGMTAAILLAEGGVGVTLYERQERIGKKLLQTGNGRCNLSHTPVSLKDYRTEQYPRLERILANYPEERERVFLRGLGIELCERDGCLYPVSRQASSVLDAYRFRLRELGVTVLTETEVEALRHGADGLELEYRTSGGLRRRGGYGAAILACGGMAGVYREAEHNGYGIAERLGHRLTRRHPALCPLQCAGEWRSVAGVRADADCILYIDGQERMRSAGEVQLTASGLSGIPIFQLSLYADAPEERQVEVALDFLPFLGTYEEGKRRFWERTGRLNGRSLEEFCAGWLQKKLAIWLIKAAGQKPSTPLRELSAAELERLYTCLRRRRVRVSGSGDYRAAQVQTGGVRLEELSESLESVKLPGVYLAGEMLDVTGACGGYNLHFALASAQLCADAILRKEEKRCTDTTN